MPPKKTETENETTDKNLETAAASGVSAATPENDDIFEALTFIDEGVLGSIYPIMQWVNGDARLKKEGGITYTGGFFVTDEQQVQIPGMEPVTLVNRDTQEINGYGARDLELSFITHRKSWNVDNELGQFRFANDEYDEAVAFAEKNGGKVTGRTQVLVAVKGYADPIVLTTHGFVAKHLTSQSLDDRGILADVKIKLVNAMSRAQGKGKKPFASCAFWCKVGPQRNTDGSPVYTEVGSDDQKSNVTLPCWLNEPTQVDNDTLKKHYVGHVQYTANQNAFADAQTWASQWSPEVLAPQRAKKLAALQGKEAASAATGALPGKQEEPNF